MYSHLVKEKDEVDGEGDKQRQQAHIIKIPGKVILKGKKNKEKKTFMCFCPFVYFHAN